MNYIQSPLQVEEAYNRIKGYIHLTPIIQSETLDLMLSPQGLKHQIFFKIDSLQKTGAFKVRGVLNHLLSLKEQGVFPQKVAAYSTGNHGIGLAFAAQKLGIKAKIYLPKDTALVKQQAAKYYGAEVVYTDTRKEAEDGARNAINEGFYYLHPSDSDSTIAGAGTICYEAIKQLPESPDAIFASCGGGGLLSGAYLAKSLLAKNSLLIGSEPLQANDAYLSLQNNQIYQFSSSPNTVADGLRALRLSERTFSYVRNLNDFYLVDEYSIYYWTAWLIHLLKVVCEPSCALNMFAVQKWLSKQTESKKVLVLISGGNIDPILYQELWKESYLLIPPHL